MDNLSNECTGEQTKVYLDEGESVLDVFVERLGADDLHLQQNRLVCVVTWQSSAMTCECFRDDIFGNKI